MFTELGYYSYRTTLPWLLNYVTIVTKLTLLNSTVCKVPCIDYVISLF